MVPLNYILYTTLLFLGGAENKNGIIRKMKSSIEQERLNQIKEGQASWKKWGPYLSERQWGTVREDYSETGDAWGYFSHQQSKSRAYRWGEDGIGGISDDQQILCFALSLWNGNDPILKERLFGLTNNQGNHGEDVKEYYFYLDNTPTHSYMKYLYKYPQNPYPYEELVVTNQHRTILDPEFELLDTGVFEENRYFDVLIEYAKESPTDIGIRITVVNKGPEAAQIHLLPTLWFRNTWSWDENSQPPILELVKINGSEMIRALQTDPELEYEFGEYNFFWEGEPRLLFTNNESNHRKLFNGDNASPYVKDGINDFIVHGHDDVVNPDLTGTKVSAHYQFLLQPGESKSIHLRLVKDAKVSGGQLDKLPELFEKRKKEADEFYNGILSDKMRANEDATSIFRQAMAGMLWTKQFFNYDVSAWLKEQGITPWTHLGDLNKVRNTEWHHLDSSDIISMPDKWEYPWFAAWDLAFHMLPFYDIDPVFTKDQLYLVLGSEYQHPNGQIPAYEWNFSDVNPPVHAWVVMETYLREKVENKDTGDTGFLRYCFGKLLLNFNWWINERTRKDTTCFRAGSWGLIT